MKLTSAELKHCLNIFSKWDTTQLTTCTYLLLKDNGFRHHVSIHTACKEATKKIEELEKSLKDLIDLKHTSTPPLTSPDRHGILALLV